MLPENTGSDVNEKQKRAFISVILQVKQILIMLLFLFLFCDIIKSGEFETFLTEPYGNKNKTKGKDK